jgi:hypothetical protein
VVLDVVPGYMHDIESHGFATVLEWLNPEYTSSVSLQASLQHAALEQASAEAMRGTPRPRRVRIAAVQYLLRPIACFEDFVTRSSSSCTAPRTTRPTSSSSPNSSPCSCSATSMSPLRRWPCAAWPGWRPNTRRCSCGWPRKRASTSSVERIPSSRAGKVFNAAHLFTPNGQVFRQKKVHLTPTESGPYQLSRGHGLYLYHTDFGNIAILICYDVEFPEVAG